MPRTETRKAGGIPTQSDPAAKRVPLTKREEIREGIAWLLLDQSKKHLNEVVPDIRKTIFWNHAGVIMHNLHSQGCVLKVDRELPKPKDPKYLMWQKDEIVDAGYVAIEPLIEQ